MKWTDIISIIKRQNSRFTSWDTFTLNDANEISFCHK
jgi:hypothetical protein